MAHVSTNEILQGPLDFKDFEKFGKDVLKVDHEIEIKDNINKIAFILPDVFLSKIKWDVPEWKQYEQIKKDFNCVTLKIKNYEEIDYSEYKEIEKYKAIPITPYKDGLLLVAREDYRKKGMGFINLCNYSEEDDAEGIHYFQKLLNLHSLNDGVISAVIASLDDLNLLKQLKEKCVLYIVCPKVSKTTAFKIVLLNNNNINSLYKHLLKINEKEEVSDSFKFMLKYAPTVLKKGAIESFHINDLIMSMQQSEEAQKEIDLIKGIPNKLNLLQMFYYKMLTEHFVRLIDLLHEVVPYILSEEKTEGTWLDLYKGCDGDLEKITSVTFDFLKEIDLKDSISVLKNYKHGKEIENKISGNEIMYRISYVSILMHHTNQGTSLPLMGPINYHEMGSFKPSEINTDCYLYWAFMSPKIISCGWLESHQALMHIDNGECVNHKLLYSTFKGISEFDVTNYKLLKKLNDETTNSIKNILRESFQQGTGEWIPYNACFEIKDDPNFKYVRFVESKHYITFFITDEKERVIFDTIDKEKMDFNYCIINSGQIHEDSDLEKSCAPIYLKVAAAVRDWKVLIERDSTMQYRGKCVPTGVDTNITRYCYLPRVRYNRLEGSEKKERTFYNENKKFSGERRAHIRKLPSGSKPSKYQLLLAERNNIPVPENHTFVKESIWGSKGMTKKEVIYRTKSFHGLLYVSDHESHKAASIKELSPAGFEERMSKYMGKKGWDIIERDNYDGGIDIRGLKEFPDGVIKKLIVQCKHQRKPIGPDVIRELIGAKEVEDDGYEKVMMVITSSRFTPGSMEVAKKHNVQLIDGDKLLNEME
tara:strand:+ start:776 stop:3229 length:2454 start_codon:yes stop_codon:yes gene_type:complete